MYTKDEIRKMFPEVDESSIDVLFDVFNLQTDTSLDIVEYNCECSMCGMETLCLFNGMCPHCEQVWNG